MNDKERNDKKRERDLRMYAKFYAGDETAFDTIMRENYKKVFSYVCCHTKNKEDAEDITQDVFAELWIQHSRFRGDSQISNYLIKIARNKLYHKIIKEQKMNFSDTPIDEYYDLQDDNIDIEEDFIRKMVAKDIGQKIEELPENQRKVVKYRFYEELSNKEIAEKTGAKAKTVSKRLSDGLKKLKKKLE